ncbi:MAG: MFS transporter [Candidatus Aenigmatarchaeota archaeon]
MSKKIYYLEFLLDVSAGIIAPFIILYALHLGFSNLFIGSFNAILNISYILTFFISLFLVNPKIIKTVFSVALLLWGLSIAILYYAKSEIIFIFAIFLRAISSALISVCYTWLISKVFTTNRYEKVSNLAIIYASATLITTVISGFLISIFSYFLLIFYIPLILSIFSIFVLQKIRVEDNIESKKIKDVKEIFRKLKDIFKDEKLKRYSLFIFFFYFAVGIAGPFFSVFLKKVLEKSEFEWSLIVATEMLVFLLFSSVIKRLNRKFDIISLFQLATFFISLVPLIWVTTKSFEIILLLSFVSGIAWNLFSILHTTYVTKNFGMTEKISFINIFIGLGSIFGNFVGGIISQINLEYAFYISFVFRLFASFLVIILIGKTMINFVHIGKTIFLSLDFFTYIFKEFILEAKKIKLLALYNRKKDIHKS